MKRVEEAHLKHKQEAQGTLESGRTWVWQGAPSRDTSPSRLGVAFTYSDLSGFSLIDQGTLPSEGGGKWGLVRDPSPSGD